MALMFYMLKTIPKTVHYLGTTAPLQITIQNTQCN